MMPFFASRRTSQASNASVQRRKGQSFARNTTSKKKRGEKRDKRKTDKNREARSASFPIDVFLWRDKREREREREGEGEGEKTSR